MKKLYPMLALCVMPQLSIAWNGQTNPSKNIYAQPRGTTSQSQQTPAPQYNWGLNSDRDYWQASPVNADIGYWLNRGDYNRNFTRWDNDLDYRYQDYDYVPQPEKYSSANFYGLGRDWAPDYNTNRYENRALNYGGRAYYREPYYREPYRSSRWR